VPRVHTASEGKRCVRQARASGMQRYGTAQIPRCASGDAWRRSTQKVACAVGNRTRTPMPSATYARHVKPARHVSFFTASHPAGEPPATMSAPAQTVGQRVKCRRLYVHAYDHRAVRQPSTGASAHQVNIVWQAEAVGRWGGGGRGSGVAWWGGGKVVGKAGGVRVVAAAGTARVGGVRVLGGGAGWGVCESAVRGRTHHQKEKTCPTPRPHARLLGFSDRECNQSAPWKIPGIRSAMVREPIYEDAKSVHEVMRWADRHEMVNGERSSAAR